jgi:hypothetical protein
MKSTLPTAGVALGLALLIANFLWGVMFPANRSWTPEKSQQLSQLGSQANLLKFKLVEAQQRPSMHGGAGAAELKEQYDKVKAEYDVLHAEFQNKLNRPKTAATILRWSGIAFVAAGAIIVFANRGG